MDEKTIEAMRDLTKTQCMPGNYNYDPYMHGMANGMILLLAIAEGKQPKYLDAPEAWLRKGVNTT